MRRLHAALIAVALPIADMAAQTAPTDTERHLGVVAATGFARGDVVGYHGLIGLESRRVFGRVRMRTEALFADLGHDEKTAALALTATVSALARNHSPYLLASWTTAARGGWQRGWSVGAGGRFGVAQRTVFAEARAYAFHDPAGSGPFDGDWRYIWVPVSIGLRF